MRYINSSLVSLFFYKIASSFFFFFPVKVFFSHQEVQGHHPTPSILTYKPRVSAVKLKEPRESIHEISKLKKRKKTPFNFDYNLDSLPSSFPELNQNLSTQEIDLKIEKLQDEIVKLVKKMKEERKKNRKKNLTPVMDSSIDDTYLGSEEYQQLLPQQKIKYLKNKQKEYRFFITKLIEKRSQNPSTESHVRSTSNNLPVGKNNSKLNRVKNKESANDLSNIILTGSLSGLGIVGGLYFFQNRLFQKPTTDNSSSSSSSSSSKKETKK